MLSLGIGYETKSVSSRVLQDLNSDTRLEIGNLFGFFMMTSYLLSRFPQLYKNYKRKNVKGISYLMFGAIIMGNIWYIASIFFYSIDPTFINAKLPYLLGSFGAIFLDGIFFSQYIYYSRKQKKLEII